jgi:hypothetical protein
MAGGTIRTSTSPSFMARRSSSGLKAVEHGMQSAPIRHTASQATIHSVPYGYMIAMRVPLVAPAASSSLPTRREAASAWPKVIRRCGITM